MANQLKIDQYHGAFIQDPKNITIVHDGTQVPTFTSYHRALGVQYVDDVKDLDLYAAPDPEHTALKSEPLTINFATNSQTLAVRTMKARRYGITPKIRATPPQDVECDKTPVPARPVKRVEPAVVDRPLPVHQYVAVAEPVIAAPPARRIENVAPIVNADAPPTAAEIKEFWEIINAMKFADILERGIADQRRHVARIIPAEKNPLFKNVYSHFITVLHNLLVDHKIGGEDVYARNKIAVESDRLSILSFAIAMGEDTYNTLSSEIEFLEAQFQSGDIASLNAVLPDELKFAF